MKTLWIGVAVSLASPLATAQTTIYKHVDENGRVTYTNRPMKGAIVLELEPLSTIPGLGAQAAGCRGEGLGEGPGQARETRGGDRHAEGNAGCRGADGRRLRGPRDAEGPRRRPPEDPPGRARAGGEVARGSAQRPPAGAAEPDASSPRCASPRKPPTPRPRSRPRCARRSTAPPDASGGCRPQLPSTRRTSRRSRKSSAR